MTDEVKTGKPANDAVLAIKQTILDLAIQSAVGFDLQSQQALPFVKSLVKDWYEVNDEGEICCNGRTPFGDDFKPLPIENVGVSLKTSHGYLFKSEQSATKDAPTPKPVVKSRQEMSVEEKARYVGRYGSEAFLALPATPVQTLPPEQRGRSNLTPQEKSKIIAEKGGAYFLSLPA